MRVEQSPLGARLEHRGVHLVLSDTEGAWMTTGIHAPSMSARTECERISPGMSVKEFFLYHVMSAKKFPPGLLLFVVLVMYVL